jgi:hypothetical protein
MNAAAGCAILAFAAAGIPGALVGAVQGVHEGCRRTRRLLAAAPTLRRRCAGPARVDRCPAGLARDAIAKCSVLVLRDNDKAAGVWRRGGWNETAWNALQRQVPAGAGPAAGAAKEQRR